MKRVLMIAFHYPPFNVSSGLQRTLAFSRYLPEFGWEPAILTVSTRAYPSVSDAHMAEIPASCRVERAFARDTARHMTVLGHYPRWLALPDRWATWCLGGVPSGLKIIKQFSPDIIFSTYPIATAHLLGLMLNKISGLPWVTDFRDPMTQDDYPRDPLQHRAYRWIERKAMTSCARAIFTTPGAKKLYAARYSNLPSKRLEVVANGYDESVFTRITETDSPIKNGKINLLHSGILYPEERDPRQFYGAIATLLNGGKISPQHLQITLRGTGHDNFHAREIARYGISDIVRLGESIPYEDALREMLISDGLLLFQAENCNYQIPAKLYEYIRAGRPIFAMTDPKGDTAMELLNADQKTVYPLNDERAIAEGFLKFIEGLQQGTLKGVDIEVARRFDRYSRTKELGNILNSVYTES